MADALLLESGDGLLLESGDSLLLNDYVSPPGNPEFNGAESLGIYLTGGGDNTNPDLSIGGARSSAECGGMVAIMSTPVEGLIIESATPRNGEGEATISIVDNAATYTPKNCPIGAAVLMNAGDRKILTGGNANYAVRVFRALTGTFSGTATFTLVDAMTGVLSMADIDDADRQAGETHYRGVILWAHGGYDVKDIKIWIPESGQASYELGTEAVASGTIQAIADDKTAPAAVSFSAAITEGTAITPSDITAGNGIGLWIKRIFPAAGTESAKNNIEFRMKYKGA